MSNGDSTDAVYKVYKITNIINGKVYIGQTRKSLERRFRGHVTNGRCRKLYGAIKKYGAENFSIELIEICSSPEELTDREAYWIMQYNSVAEGYNLVSKSDVYRECSQETRDKLKKAKTGTTHTEESKIKIGEASKGRKRSKEATERIAAKNTGKKRTDEQRARMSEAAKKRGVNPDTLEKFKNSGRGRIPTQETLDKRKETRINNGKVRSRGAIEKTASANRGRKNTEECKQRMSEVRKGRPLSPEHLESVRKAAERRRGMSIPREFVERRVASRLANKLKKLEESNNAIIT